MREITLPAQQETTAIEVLVAVSISYLHRTVEAGITFATEAGEQLIPDMARIQYITLRGEWYDLLMSESPDWAPGKPAGSFREADVFQVLDLKAAAEAAPPTNSQGGDAT